MKVAITGHTRGIGKEIATYFKSRGAEIIGFSKSENFDISTSDVREKIVELARDCDVFVNNAFTHLDHGQFQLLKLIRDAWIGQDKMIINLSSRAGDSVEDHTYPYLWYAKLKQEQDIFCESAFRFPWILNLKPGAIDTDMTKDQEVQKMDVTSVSGILHFVLENKDRFRINSVTFTPLM